MDTRAQVLADLPVFPEGQAGCLGGCWEDSGFVRVARGDSPGRYGSRTALTHEPQFRPSTAHGLPAL